VLNQLKHADNTLTTACIRTGNAGCYKDSDTLLSIKQIYKETGIIVRRIDFADAQSGKGSCDRMASVTKANVRRFVNEKNDCVTSSNFVDAAKSTRCMTVMACRLSDSSSINKTRWQGVQNFNNISCELLSNKINHRSKTADEEIKVTLWRAFDIGFGQSFTWSELNTSTAATIPIQIGARHDNSKWHADSLAKGRITPPLLLHSNASLFFFRRAHTDDDNLNNDI
jgi:hypothetical protein